MACCAKLKAVNTDPVGASRVAVDVRGGQCRPEPVAARSPLTPFCSTASTSRCSKLMSSSSREPESDGGVDEDVERVDLAPARNGPLHVLELQQADNGVRATLQDADAVMLLLDATRPDELPSYSRRRPAHRFLRHRRAVVEGHARRPAAGRPPRHAQRHADGARRAGPRRISA